ncbi:hypothetical protein TL16_g06942 [Triparma laevis f. inornata]|uniref:Uncharacterized protein n=1 Tax=Triparma laevis f. inornata TaxID=1714386 RepID=A0A9W7AV07_9STRA|nr:hypothetical protein TL16_g06942 [Triparma laevis f. inornata]
MATLVGLGPLLEGLNVWTGKEDPDLLLSGPVMYAGLKAVEIAFESIPESIIQIGGLLKQNYEDIQTIQIIGVISSIVSGAFIMTDGNFGFNLSKFLASAGDPYYGWISKIGGWEKRRQMFGMFLFNACYFAQFVFAMSLFAEAFGSRAPLFILLGVEFCAVSAYMGLRKGELFGWALLGHPSIFHNYIGPLLVWAWYYMLVSAVPLLIAAAPMELGPDVFAGTMVWRLLTNGGIIYVALGDLGTEHYLSVGTGMTGYAASLGLAVVGLALFLNNCDPKFDRSLFWKAKRGEQHARECWSDEKVWEKDFKTKDEEIWKGWIETIHPTYLPFDLMTQWLKRLVEKFERGVERPEWINAENEKNFIKRIAEIYIWKGTGGEEVDMALVKLFGRSGADLEEREDGLSLSFTKRKKKVQPV